MTLIKRAGPSGPTLGSPSYPLLTQLLFPLAGVPLSDSAAAPTFLGEFAFNVTGKTGKLLLSFGLEFQATNTAASLITAQFRLSQAQGETFANSVLPNEPFEVLKTSIGPGLTGSGAAQRGDISRSAILQGWTTSTGSPINPFDEGAWYLSAWGSRGSSGGETTDFRGQGSHITLLDL